jgi:hypothetical protein
MCDLIASAVADVNHSAVLALTHLLTEDASEWLDVDVALMFGLRQTLTTCSCPGSRSIIR